MTTERLMMRRKLPPRGRSPPMKCMQVHVSVESIDNAVAFYSTLFAAQPSVVKPDYAKWMLEDPRVNFAISTRGEEPGLDHLGILVASEGVVQEASYRVDPAERAIVGEGKPTKR